MANDDLEYKRWIQDLPCCMCNQHSGVVMHHRTGAGMGLRAEDREGMPLCEKHHRDFHDLGGMFKNWKKEDLRDWQWAMIRIHLALYEGRDAHDKAY